MSEELSKKIDKMANAFQSFGLNIIQSLGEMKAVVNRLDGRIESLESSLLKIKSFEALLSDLVNHEDRGAYEGMHFDDREEELKQHKKDLQDAKEIILKEFPQKEVKLFFGYLKEGTDDQFEIKEV